MRLGWCVPLLVAGCAGKGQPAMPSLPPIITPQHPIAVPAEPQRTGDANAGYAALVNKGYVGCGLPCSLYSTVFGPAAASDRLPGRDGDNATLPYGQTAFTQPSGVEVVTANCLSCHAAKLNGQVVIGLGTTTPPSPATATAATRTATRLGPTIAPRSSNT